MKKNNYFKYRKQLNEDIQNQLDNTTEKTLKSNAKAFSYSEIIKELLSNFKDKHELAGYYFPPSNNKKECVQTCEYNLFVPTEEYLTDIKNSSNYFYERCWSYNSEFITKNCDWEKIFKKNVGYTKKGTIKSFDFPTRICFQAFEKNSPLVISFAQWTSTHKYCGKSSEFSTYNPNLMTSGVKFDDLDISDQKEIYNFILWKIKRERR